MNILDEGTKAMLDAGKVAVLDGGYLAMSPETLMRLVADGKDIAIEIANAAIGEQILTEEANNSSICAMCGGDDISGTACSSLILETGYGSANDLERVSVPLCGECADRLYAEMCKMPGARIDDTQI